MVRVNLVAPKKLSDQHLIAEYAEILILKKQLERYPCSAIPKDFCLGAGHQMFFRDKGMYLKKRHDILAGEMKKRGFKPKKTFSLKKMTKDKLNNWKPQERDIKIVKKRIMSRLMEKPEWYRYYGKNKNKKFWRRLCKKQTS